MLKVQDKTTFNLMRVLIKNIKTEQELAFKFEKLLFEMKYSEKKIQ